jgi:hypothetical protein
MTPRIRFLKKQGIDVREGKNKKTTTIAEEVVLGNNNNSDEMADEFNAINDNGGGEDDEDFLKITRKDVFNEISETDVKVKSKGDIKIDKPIYIGGNYGKNVNEKANHQNGCGKENDQTDWPHWDWQKEEVFKYRGRRLMQFLFSFSLFFCQ